MNTEASAWARIRRARLVQILGVYLGVSFAILQAVDIFANRLPIPDWTFIATFVLLLVGLPVVAATALIQAAPTAASRTWLTWSRTARGGLAGAAGLVLVVVGISILGVVGMGPASSLIAKGVIDARERILIAEFMSPTGDTTLAGALTEAFRVDFEQSPVVTLVPPLFVRDALVRMGRDPTTLLDPTTARELAEREGIKALVAGEVNAVGRDFVLTARLVSAADGVVLASHRESADSAGLIGAVDQLSKTLRKQIGESLRSLRGNEPLAQVSTPSLEALRRYSQAVRVADIERDHDRAVSLLEEAIRLDPAFAMAHRKLGVVLRNQAGPSDRVEEALRSAYEHRDRLTDRERYITLGTYYRYVEHDDDKAAAAYRTLLDLHPNETAALNNLAIIYGDRREHARAEELYRRALAIDSLGSIYYTNLISQLVAQGDLAAADSMLALYQGRFPPHPQERFTAASLAIVRGDYDAADEALRAVADDRSIPATARGGALMNLAQLDLLHGRPAAAVEKVRQAGTMLPDGMAMDTVYELEIGRAFIDALLSGDVPAAEARIERMLQRHPLEDVPASERPYASLVSFFATIGRPDRARAYYDEHYATSEPDARRRMASDLQFWRASIAFAEGRAGDAISGLRAVLDDSPCPVCALPLLGRAYEQAAQPDSAIAVYTRYVETPWLARIGNDSMELARILVALGALHEDRGDRVQAARYYAAFVDLWRDAEAPLQPRVQEAQRALRRLTTEGS
jgi:eukaryotic-like serine/threonine-protein kinase